MIIKNDKFALINVTEALDYKNQVNDAIILLIENKDNQDNHFVVTSRKRGDLEVYLRTNEDETPNYELTAYMIEESMIDNPHIGYISDIKGSEQYRDGGITLNEEVLAQIILDFINNLEL